MSSFVSSYLHAIDQAMVEDVVVYLLPFRFCSRKRTFLRTVKKFNVSKSAGPAMQYDRLFPAHPVVAAIALVSGPLCAAEARDRAPRNLEWCADSPAATCWRRVGMRWPAFSMGADWESGGEA